MEATSGATVSVKCGWSGAEGGAQREDLTWLGRRGRQGNEGCRVGSAVRGSGRGSRGFVGVGERCFVRPGSVWLLRAQKSE